MTDNHDYDAPEKGASDWHLPLNSNFEQLDTDVEIRDQEAERDSYQSKAGAKFFATDTGNVYLGNGSEWLHAPVADHDHDGDSVSPARLNGDIVDRNDPIDSLSGNVYVTDDYSDDPTENDGDIVFYVDND